MRLTRPCATAVASLWLTLAPAVCAAQDTCGEWRWANPHPQADALFEVEHAGGRFVAVGDHGRILTSPDGAAWTVQHSGVTVALHGAAWNGAHYVAVGDKGTALTSPDGRAWTARATGTSTVLRGLTWDGSQFVAVGGEEAILTSPDGLAWTTRRFVPGSFTTLAEVTRGGALLVAVGDNGSVRTSPDGIQWTARSSGTGEELTSVAWNGLRFVASARQECPPECLSAAMLHSDDGITWVRHPATHLPADVVWTGSEFMAPASGALLVSDDGTSWSTRSFPGIDPTSVAVGPALVVLHETQHILTSANGTSWTERFSGPTDRLWSAAWSGTRFVALGNLGRILTSTDGASWAVQDLANDMGFHTVAWGDRFVATGRNGAVVTSPDGLAWTQQPGLPAGFQITDLVWDGTQFVGVGYDDSGSAPYPGLVVTSPDGVSWTSRSPTAWSLVGLAWNGLQYLAVGASGTILTSPDTVTWTARDSGTLEVLLSAAWAGTQFVVVGGTVGSGGPAVALTSPDGITWTWRETGSEEPLRKVAWNRSRLVAVSSFGSVLTSTDGASWTPDDWATTGLFDVRPIGTDFLSVGDRGAIVVLDCSGFADVPYSHFARRHIRALAEAGVSGGCSASPALFCPEAPVSREQAAVLLLRAHLGPGYVPPDATGVFDDVPPADPFARWIEDLVTRGITGGCSASPPLFCPGQPVTRAQAAVFLVTTFSLPLP